MDSLLRLELLYGSEAVNSLKDKKVAVFGVGGVGSFTVEALARSGVGHLTLIDMDRVAISNLNRQLPARMDTLDRFKVDVVREHILSVQPNCDVVVYPELFKNYVETPELLSEDWDYVVDAIDDIPAKASLIEWAYQKKIPIISAMGAGNKKDPTRFQIADISKTKICPLARALRKKLREKGIQKGVQTVFSTELPTLSVSSTNLERPVPGSVCHTTGTAGLIVASVVINDLTNSR